jgi:hypothetical protein
LCDIEEVATLRQEREREEGREGGKDRTGYRVKCVIGCYELYVNEFIVEDLQGK